MKAIIYAGIGLFSVATVYGLADYYSSQKKGTLNNLYKEEEHINETEKPVVNTAVITKKGLESNLISSKTVALNTTDKTTKKSKHQKRAIHLEDFSRGRIIEPMPAEIKVLEFKKEEPAKIEEIKPKIELPAVDIKTAEVVKPERRISLEMFSRAPLKRLVKLDKKVTASKMN